MSNDSNNKSNTEFTKQQIEEGNRTLNFHVGFFIFRIIAAIIVILLMIRFSF